MAEPVGDLVVDLSLDAARFDEQMARVRRHFSGTETDAKKTAAVVEQSLSRQALAAQKAGISVGQYKAAMRMLPAQFSGDYLRVIDNKGKTHDVLTGSDDGRHSNTSLAWGAGVQFNPTESVAIDIAYEGSGSGDWRTDGFIVGVGYKF